ncbi:MAG: arylesterase [Patescibacteria group bacterium]|nr:arylesterase [Patescibacteria group bacterium]
MRRSIVLSTIGVMLLGSYIFNAYIVSRPVTIQKVNDISVSGTDIIAFGDSLVAGIGATPGHDLVSDLSREIGKPIVNLGHSGDTTADALARVSELDKYHPGIVIVLLGGNDFLQKVPVDESFANLAKIVETVQKKRAEALIVGLRVSPTRDNFDDAYQKLADASHAAYVPDVLDGFYGDPAYMSDTLHPNDRGYAIMAARIAPALKKLLR